MILVLPYEQRVRIEFVYRRDAAYFGEPYSVKRPWIGYLLAGSVILGGIGLAAWMDDPATKLIGVAVAAGGMLWGLIVRRSRPSAAVLADLMAEATGPRRWLLTDDGMESETELTSSRYALDVFRSVVAWPRSYRLATDWGYWVDIPREPLTPDDDRALRAVLTRHQLLPPDGPTC